MDLVGHDFFDAVGLYPAEIGYLLDLAAELKAKKKGGHPARHAARQECGADL